MKRLLFTIFLLVGGEQLFWPRLERMWAMVGTNAEINLTLTQVPSITSASFSYHRGGMFMLRLLLFNDIIDNTFEPLIDKNISKYKYVFGNSAYFVLLGSIPSVGIVSQNLILTAKNAHTILQNFGSQQVQISGGAMFNTIHAIGNNRLEAYFQWIDNNKNNWSNAQHADKYPFMLIILLAMLQSVSQEANSHMTMVELYKQTKPLLKILFNKIANFYVKVWNQYHGEAREYTHQFLWRTGGRVWQDWEVPQIVTTLRPGDAFNTYLSNYYNIDFVKARIAHENRGLIRQALHVLRPKTVREEIAFTAGVGVGYIIRRIGEKNIRVFDNSKSNQDIAKKVLQSKNLVGTSQRNVSEKIITPYQLETKPSYAWPPNVPPRQGEESESEREIIIPLQEKTAAPEERPSNVPAHQEETERIESLQSEEKSKSGVEGEDVPFGLFGGLLEPVKK